MSVFCDSADPIVLFKNIGNVLRYQARLSSLICQIHSHSLMLSGLLETDQ